MKLYGGGSEDWGGWNENETYPWYDLNFVDTQSLKDVIFQRLLNNENFSYIRLGDGPLGYVYDMENRWHPKDDKIKKCLIDVFKKIENYDDEKFMVGLPFDTPKMSGGLVASVKAMQLCWKVVDSTFPKNRKYFAHNLPHWMLCYEKEIFSQFLDILSSKRVCVVGNEKFPIEVLKFLFGENVTHIKVPHLNVFYSHEAATQEVLNFAKDVDIFLFASGLLTYPTMVNVYEKIGNNVSMMDIGSIIDPFVNHLLNPSAKHALTHSGRRGWWLVDFPEAVPNFINERKKR